ncbi:MAG: hypothetical protein QW764_04870 [Desulfurococcaceae archaeon]
MILDEEVFAVILAVSVVASTVGIALVLRPDVVEPFNAIGLLNENCKIGELPRVALNSTVLRLCIFIANYMGKPVYYRVVYKIGDADTLPTATTPSPESPVAEWFSVLGNKKNTTILVNVPVYTSKPLPANVTLIFELWMYDTGLDSWVYTGRWVHLHLNITPPLV